MEGAEFYLALVYMDQFLGAAKRIEPSAGRNLEPFTQADQSQRYGILRSFARPSAAWGPPCRSENVGADAGS